jgi:hypothetical protein
MRPEVVREAMARWKEADAGVSLLEALGVPPPSGPTGRLPRCHWACESRSP